MVSKTEFAPVSALVCGALILVLTLAGCGGDGGGDRPLNQTQTPPVATEELSWDQGNWDELNWQ